MVYKVPLKDENYIEGDEFFSYKGSELKVNIGECSNKIIPICFIGRPNVYIDLENGNIVSGYRPGGNAFILGNVISLYRKNNYELEISNMVYWLESYSLGESTIIEAGNGMAENPRTTSYLSSVVLSSSQAMGDIFSEYLGTCAGYIYVLYDTFYGRKSRLKEFYMLGDSNMGKVWSGERDLMKILSYLRARNKDFEALYCRESDSFYVKLANKYGISQFKNWSDITVNLRSIAHKVNSVMTQLLKNGDKSPTAELHDFALDLEKINLIMRRI